MTTGPTNLKPASELRAGEVFFYNGERFKAIKDAVQDSGGWVVVSQGDDGNTVNYHFAEGEEVGI